MSTIAAGTARRYEWPAGRSLQFTAVWDFHLSSAQREKGSTKKEKLLSSCPASWTEYQLELCMGRSVKAQGSVGNSQALIRARAVSTYTFLSKFCIFPCCLFLIDGGFASLLFRLYFFLRNIHRWATLLCMRPPSIHSDICMLFNLSMK